MVATAERIRLDVPMADIPLRHGLVLKFLEPRMMRASPTTPPGLPDSVGALYRSNHGMFVIAALEATRHGALLHVSMSLRKRDPTWDEIKAVREAFYPETIDVMMMLPQKQDYLALHDHCFHLWQTPFEWAIQ